MQRAHVDQRCAGGDAKPGCDVFGDRGAALRDDAVAIGHAGLFHLLAHDGNGECGLAHRVHRHLCPGAAAPVQQPFVRQPLQGLVDG